MRAFCNAFLSRLTSGCHVVHSHLAELWNIRLLHVVQTGPKLRESWAYEPGKPPQILVLRNWSAAEKSLARGATGKAFRVYCRRRRLQKLSREREIERVLREEYGCVPPNQGIDEEQDAGSPPVSPAVQEKVANYRPDSGNGRR
jgi:hypothetical protein